MLGRVVRLVATLAALATLLLPTDLIPDFAPLVGWLDDLVATCYLAFELFAIWRRRINQSSRSQTFPDSHRHSRRS